MIVYSCHRSFFFEAGWTIWTRTNKNSLLMMSLLLHQFSTPNKSFLRWVVRHPPPIELLPNFRSIQCHLVQYHFLDFFQTLIMLFHTFIVSLFWGCHGSKNFRLQRNAAFVRLNNFGFKTTSFPWTGQTFDCRFQDVFIFNRSVLSSP